MRERMAESARMLRERLTFGKSNIHGWGLIAKQPVRAGTMVIEYRGETVRQGGSLRTCTQPTLNHLLLQRILRTSV